MPLTSAYRPEPAWSAVHWIALMENSSCCLRSIRRRYRPGGNRKLIAGGDRSSRRRSGAGDEHRAVGTLQQPAADRAEQYPLVAMPAWPHQDQLCLSRALDQHLVRAAAHDLAFRRDVRVLLPPRIEVTVEVAAEDLLGGGGAGSARCPAAVVCGDHPQRGAAYRR